MTLVPGIFPDATGVRALELIVVYCRAAQYVDDVVDAIASDPAYPRPGLLPVYTRWQFDPDRSVRWVKADVKAVRTLLNATSFYGIYAHCVRATEDWPREEVVRPLSGGVAGRVQVFIPNAFASFASFDDVPHFRAVAGRRRGGVRPDRAYRGPRRHAIEEIACGHVDANGAPCPRPVRAVYSPEGRMRYEQGVCWREGHLSPLPREVEDLVLQAIEEHYDEPKNTAALDGITLRAPGVVNERRRIAERIAELEAQLDALRKERLAHAAAKDEEQVGSCDRVGAEIGGELRCERQRLVDATDGAERRRELAAGGREQILALVRRVHSLLAEARRLDDAGVCEDAVRRVVAATVAEVRATQVGASVWRISIRFHTGGVTEALLVTQFPYSTHAERAYAAARLAAHADAAAVARELDETRTLLGARAAWTPARVRAAAVEFSHFERFSPREGRHRTLAALAADLREEPATVLRVALLGRLGPARVDGDTIALCPTQRELEAAFAEYARRAVAKRHKWPEDDTVALGSLERCSGVTTRELHKRASRGSVLAHDLARRTYSLESVVAPQHAARLGAALAAAPAHVRALDRAHWVARPRAEEAVPLGWSAVCAATVVVAAPGARATGVPSMEYAWLSPAVLGALARGSVEAAIAAAGYVGLAAADFVTRDDAAVLLRGVLPRSSYKMIQRACAGGRLLELRALGVVTHHLRPVHYVHLPPAVRGTDDAGAARAWLRGAFTPPAARGGGAAGAA